MYIILYSILISIVAMGGVGGICSAGGGEREEWKYFVIIMIY